jgi:hypothetical protein
MMPRILLWLGLVAMLGVTAWFAMRPTPRGIDGRAASQESRATASAPPSTVPRTNADDPTADRGTRPAQQTTRVERARRDAVREQIRERRREARGRADSASGGARTRAAEEPAAEEPATDDGFVNRMGEEHAALAQAINRELSALADECVTAAGERAKHLSGTLAMNVRAIADPELGAVIDTVDVTAEGEGIDDELRDCVRESAMSMLLPTPEAGEVAFMVSMRLP